MEKMQFDLNRRKAVATTIRTLEGILTGPVPKNAAMTVSALFKRVWSEHWSNDRFLKSGWSYEVERCFKVFIEPELGSFNINDMRAAIVRDWHIGLVGTPTQANRALEVLSRMFQHAWEREWIADNPCKRVKAFREKKRKRYATPDELRRIGALIAKYSSRWPRKTTFILALLLTGARPRSLERAQWSDLREQDGYGILSFKGKGTEITGEFEQVIFPPMLMAQIKELGKPLDGSLMGCSMPNGLWDRIRQEAICPDLWMRDCRRTFATVGLSNGADLGLIGELLNHKSTQTTKIYAQLLDSRRIKAAGEIANQMSELLGG